MTVGIQTQTKHQGFAAGSSLFHIRHECSVRAASPEVKETAAEFRFGRIEVAKKNAIPASCGHFFATEFQRKSGPIVRSMLNVGRGTEQGENCRQSDKTWQCEAGLVNHRQHVNCGEAGAENRSRRRACAPYRLDRCALQSSPPISM